MNTPIYVPNNRIMADSPELRDDYNRFVREVKKQQHASIDYRISLPEKYLRGRGLEVGAFHAPLPLPKGCQADYVDKVNIAKLKEWMPETNDLYCVYPTIIDDGEKLTKVETGSYDFLIANHMLEHTENVFQTIENHIRVVREGGYLFYALPDKRHTFDKDRELTSYEHLKDEYFNGSEKNRVAHFREFGENVSKIEDENQLNAFVENHIKNNRDIHFHVWQYDTFLEHITKWIEETDLNIELVEDVQNGIEFIVIIQILTPVQQAERLIEKGELETAKKMLMRITNDDQSNLEAQNDLAVVAIMEENFNEAKKIILCILELDQSNEIALNNYKYLQSLSIE